MTPDASPLELPVGAPLSAATISADGERVACGGPNGMLAIFNEKTAAKRIVETGTESAVNAVAFANKGRYLAVGFQDGTIRLWREDSPGKPVSEHQLGHPVTRIGFSPDDAHLVALAGLKGRLSIVSLSPEPSVVSPPAAATARLLSLAFHPDGGQFLTACSDRRARVYSLTTGKPLDAGFRHDDLVHDAVYDAEGARVATVSKDRSARIWNAATGELLHRPMMHESAVHRARFSPDGELLATGTVDGVARVWDIDSGLTVFAAKLHEGPIVRVEFVRAGDSLVTAGLEGSVRNTPMVSAPEESAAWLPDLAEAIGGLRLDTEQLPQPVPREDYPESLDRTLSAPGGKLFFNWRLPAESSRR